MTWNGVMHEKVAQKEKNGPRFSCSRITLLESGDEGDKILISQGLTEAATKVVR